MEHSVRGDAEGGAAEGARGHVITQADKEILQMILEGITQGEDIDPRFPGKNLYRLLLAVDDIDSAQAAHAWIADIKAMYGVMVRFLRRICDSVYIGPNAYPIRYAALYDPSQPDMIIEECHRWGVYCRPEEEGGCVCCAAGTPKGTREEYINSKACTFGLFDHPRLPPRVDWSSETSVRTL